MLIYFVAIITKYVGPLATVHAHIDDDRQNMAECSAAGQPKLDLSDQLQDFGIITPCTNLLNSDHILCRLYY